MKDRNCPRCKTPLVTRKVRESRLAKEPYRWPPKKDRAYKKLCPNCGFTPRKELKKNRQRRKKKRN